MTPSPEAVQLVLDALNASGVPYFVTGSLVTSTYGEPRFTADADFVIDVRGGSPKAVIQSLLRDFDLEEQLSFESVTAKTIHRLYHRKTGFTIELFEMGNDAHDEARMQRRRRVHYFDRDTFFPTVEDALIAKLRWTQRLNRAKDRADILTVLSHRWREIDWPYLERWCREHGTLDLLNELKAEVQRAGGIE